MCPRLPRWYHPHLHPNHHPNLRALLSFLIKSSGVGVPKPIESTGNNRTTSAVRTAVLTDTLLNGTPLTIVDHQKAIRDGQSAVQASKKVNAAADLLSLITLMPPLPSVTPPAILRTAFESPFNLRSSMNFLCLKMSGKI